MKYPALCALNFSRVALFAALCFVSATASAQFSLEMKPQIGKVYLIKSEGVHAVTQTTATSQNITSQTMNVGVLMQTVAPTPQGTVFQVAFKDIETELQGAIANVTYNSAKVDSTSSYAHLVMARFFEKIRLLRPVLTLAKDGSVVSLTGFDSISFELEKFFPDESAIIALVDMSYRMFTEQGFKDFIEMNFKLYPSAPVKGSWKNEVNSSIMGITSQSKNTFKVVTQDDQKVATELSASVKMQLPQALIVTGSRGFGGMRGGGAVGMGGGMRGGDMGGMGGGMGGGMRGGGMGGGFGGGMGGGMRGGGMGGFGGGFNSGIGVAVPTPEQMAMLEEMMATGGGFNPEVMAALMGRAGTPAGTSAAPKMLTREDSLLQYRADSVLRVTNQKLMIQNQIKTYKTTLYDLKGKTTGTVTFDLRTGFPVSSDLSIATKGTMGVQATALPVAYFGTIKSSITPYLE